MDAFLLLLIVVASAIAGALEMMHIFDLMTGALDGRRRRPGLPH